MLKIAINLGQNLYDKLDNQSVIVNNQNIITGAKNTERFNSCIEQVFKKLEDIPCYFTNK